MIYVYSVSKTIHPLDTTHMLHTNRPPPDPSPPSPHRHSKGEARRLHVFPKDPTIRDARPGYVDVRG